ncbi:MAG TPA: carboxypeptidase-like regulatory domain-containing protein [Solirubrobacteraceae bacterium]|jgi:hypothetical protein|nr:carboxypeptidase-like regulatory domain-containing protein [Solirubrobacteraceae bacterium]
MRSRAAVSLAVQAAAVTAAALVCAAATGTPAGARAGGRQHGGCRAPRLAGLTVAEARTRAARAGCALRMRGAPLKLASVQTVLRQSPASGSRAARVTVWLNPMCFGSAASGPGLQEPVLKAGPTGLISGFYLAGGPLARFSTPGCHRPAPPPGAGTVEVLDPATGAVLATQTSGEGAFVRIPLPAGPYTIRGTFLDATTNGAHPTITQSVSIPAGYSVRQDFVLAVP